MSFEKYRRVMELLETRCRDVKEAFVLVVLADQYFDNTRECSPSVDLLMARTHLSRSSVLRAIEMLEEDQLVEVDRRYGAKHYFTLKLGDQLELKPGPKPMSQGHGFKREVGFRAARSRRPTHVTQAWVTHVPVNKTHVTQKRDLSTYRDLLPTASGAGDEAATASPRLPMPLEIRRPDPAAEAHRLGKLRRRVAGLAIGLLLDPQRGVALIQEPIVSEALLVAATKVLCGRKRVAGYAEVVVPMCASVWWRKSLYGQLVVNGKAPRPRDRARGPR